MSSKPSRGSSLPAPTCSRSKSSASFRPIVIDVDRSPAPPASLAHRTSWADQDVLDALHRDFLGKCYLCESPVRPAEFEVDHRKPRAKFDELIFEWTNLYPACDRCNGRRPEYPNEGELLDPGEGVEQRVAQSVEVVVPHPVNLCCRFEATDDGDWPARNTARELRRLHDPDTATTYRARKRTNNLLRAIYDYYVRDVYPELRRVEGLRTRRERGEPVATADLTRAERALRDLVSRRAPYTMLIRSLVGPALADLFD
jgi:5-methylcytosine-specific restriction endonuclease McrA